MSEFDKKSIAIQPRRPGDGTNLRPKTAGTKHFGRYIRYQVDKLIPVVDQAPPAPEVFIDLSTGDGKDGSGIISKSHLQVRGPLRT